MLTSLDQFNAEKNALSSTEKSRNRLVVIGHSFGGAAVFTATAPILVDRLAKANVANITGNPVPKIKSIGDLVVLINPAFEAMRFSTIHKLNAKYSNKTADGQAVSVLHGDQRPILVSLTSEADSATGLAFPAGRQLSTLFEGYSDDAPGLTHEGQLANITAVGHYEPYWTHRVSGKRNEPSSSLCESYIKPRSKIAAVDAKDAKLTGLMSLVAGEKSASLTSSHAELLPGVASRNVVWNVVTDKVFISGHNDIYGCAVAEFILELVRLAD